VSTPYDDPPIEVRRESRGWFGDPWESGICYDDDGRLIGEMRKPVPVGEKCIGCDEAIQPGDQGKTCGAIQLGGVLRPAHMHRECLLRDALGPLAHIDGRCHHYGGDGNGTSGMTVRQEALEIWRRTQEGTLYGR
jgi:hypothetical protein